MKKNVGNIDRITRIIAGAGLIGLAVTNPDMAWGYIGIVPLFTGLVGICPAYCMFGKCSIKSKK